MWYWFDINLCMSKLKSTPLSQDLYRCIFVRDKVYLVPVKLNRWCISKIHSIWTIKITHWIIIWSTKFILILLSLFFYENLVQIYQIFRCMTGTWPNDLLYNTYNTYFHSLLMVYFVNRYHFLVLLHFDFLMVRCLVPFWRIMSRTLSILIVPTTSISTSISTSTSTSIISFMIIKWVFICFRKWGRMGQVRLVVFQWKFIILLNHSKKIY